MNITENQNYQSAITLHTEIMTKAQTVASTIVDLAKSLKEMRDRKLFIHLGYEDFGNYTEKMCNIGSRQAYNFIQVIEGFGESKMLEHANLGITKLNALLSVPASERDTFIEDYSVSDISVSELKATIKSLEEKVEQLELFEDNAYKQISKSNTSIEVANKEKEKIAEELEKIKADKLKLERELKVEREKPVDVAVRELSDEELDKIKTEIAVEFKADAEKYIAEAENLKQKLAEKESQVEKLESADISEKVSFYFDNLQNATENLLTSVSELDDGQQTIIKLAILNYLEEIAERID